MSEDRSIEEIRERKLEELRERSEAGAAEASAPEAAGAAPDEPIHVDGPAALEEAVSSYDVVLADFYADWCGPCQMLEPVVEEIAAETDAAVVKVDVDANQALAARYQVQGIPALVVFADGQPADRMVGVQPKENLVAAIDQHV